MGEENLNTDFETTGLQSQPMSADTSEDWIEDKPLDKAPLPIDPTRQVAPYFNDEIPDR